MGHILRNVKHHLTESNLLGSSPGRTVADTLLKLAQLEPLDSSQYQIGSLSRNSVSILARPLCRQTRESTAKATHIPLELPEHASKGD